jgi:hypothetical protein
MSSLRSLGFRIDGIAGPDGLIENADHFADIVARDKVVHELRRFVNYFPLREPDNLTPTNIEVTAKRRVSMSSTGLDKNDIARQPRDDSEALDFLKLRLRIAKDVSERLQQLHSLCLDSAYVRSHEFVGVSLLLVAGDSPPGATVHIIDFAKTTEVPEGVTVDHMREWKEGNHEDGLLFGLIECRRCWDEVVEFLQADISVLEQADAEANEQFNEQPSAQPCCDLFGGWFRAAKNGC